MKKAAEFRGGTCDSEAMDKGDWNTPLEFTCQFGHKFKGSPRLILDKKVESVSMRGEYSAGCRQFVSLNIFCDSHSATWRRISGKHGKNAQGKKNRDAD